MSLLRLEAEAVHEVPENNSTNVGYVSRASSSPSLLETSHAMALLADKLLHQLSTERNAPPIGSHRATRRRSDIAQHRGHASCARRLR